MVSVDSNDQIYRPCGAEWRAGYAVGPVGEREDGLNTSAEFREGVQESTPTFKPAEGGVVRVHHTVRCNAWSKGPVSMSRILTITVRDDDGTGRRYAVPAM
jgi:hypothetical protein